MARYLYDKNQPIKVVKAAQMQEIDRKTIADLKVPGAVLMENAGFGCAQEIEHFAEAHGICGRKVFIFCGKGNNGGDGFVIGRHLFNRGWQVQLFLIGKKEQLKGAALLNMTICENYGLFVTELNEDNFFQVDFANVDIIVDAILGTGIKGAVRGFAAEVINNINLSDKPVFSVDMPSGLPTDKPNLEGVCVRADVTCTMGLPKIAQVIYPTKKYVGELIVLDIGFPRHLLNDETISVNLLTEGFVAKKLPKREADAYKGSCGYLAVLAGSIGMTGAATLTSKSAYLSGAGYVKLGIPQTINQIMENKLTEVLTYPLYETPQHTLSLDSETGIANLLKDVKCLALGPGLSSNSDTQQLIQRIVYKTKIPMVIDADGLNALVPDSSILWNAHDQIVLTPHIGEMERISGITKKEIMCNPVQIASDTAKKFGVVLVLKGAATIIADQEGNTYINTTGNSGMATAGAGDVLTGLIAGFITQGLSVMEAAILGVYVHGLAGDFAANEKGALSVIASDIMNNIPNAIKKLQRLEID